MKSDASLLLKKHKDLIHSVDQKVASHVQRVNGDWVVHTLMLEGVEVPFKFRRKDKYLSLAGARVNLTYYSAIEEVAGLKFQIMTVVRIKRA